MRRRTKVRWLSIHIREEIGKFQPNKWRSSCNIFTYVSFYTLTQVKLPCRQCMRESSVLRISRHRWHGDSCWVLISSSSSELTDRNLDWLHTKKSANVATTTSPLTAKSRFRISNELCRFISSCRSSNITRCSLLCRLEKVFALHK